MKKLLLTALLCFCVNAYAFNWKKVAEDDLGNFYVDVDNIKKHNGLVYYWDLIDVLEPVKLPAGNANSTINKHKVNCVEEKTTRLNTTWYSLSTGKGRIIYEDSPNGIRYPKPNTIGYVVMKFACDNAK